ncbi:MAG: divalent metal cation transporter [Gemmatimonadetes bacterium]|nr:divalent metal cation transporter [Gemmatimonadota bacterium]
MSHLVQSTRAGAMAGFGLVGVIAVALLLKYPFFEFGARYASATGRSLVEGYGDIGRWALWLFLAITIVTAIVSVSAVVLFTSYLTAYALGIDWPLPLTAAVLMGLCGGLLLLGRYRGLDLTIKVVLAVLGISTVAAVVVALPRADVTTFELFPSGIVGQTVPFAFLLALIGWMPSPVDVAVWSSLWTLAKDRATGVTTSVGVAKRDFMIGYVGTGILALAFVTLGATVLYQADVALSDAGAVFSTQLVDLYSDTLGAWSRPFVLLAAVTTMFSTTLAVTDGFPRAFARTVANLRSAPGERVEKRSDSAYWGGMIGQSTIAIVVLAFFAGSLTAMVDFATTVAFMTAPVLGYLNLTTVTSDAVPPEHRPGRAMVSLTWIGLVLLGGTGVAYVASLF